MSDEQRNPARSFGGVAEAYERGRPTYPREAALWLTSAKPLQVLELGAGTGKLTEQLVALGHDVHATEPDEAMLAILQKRLPDVRASQSPAEDIPSGDQSYDVVVSGQAFHWFDLDRALPEIARVLRPGGSLSLVWNERDERIPWVKRLGRIIGTPERLSEPAGALADSELFGETVTDAFRFWQVVHRDSIQDLVLSRSNVATLDTAGREAKLAEVLAFYEDFGRGMDGMQLPYLSRCFRAPVLARKVSPPPPEPESEESSSISGETRLSDGTDTDMLLIDFR